MKPCHTPAPPYYAVIFTSTLSEHTQGYGDMSTRMVELAAQQPGFLGMDSARGMDGLGITVCYWTSMEAIAAWKANAEHLVAQRQGYSEWYSQFETRIARVERAHRGPARS